MFEMTASACMQWHFKAFKALLQQSVKGLKNHFYSDMLLRIKSHIKGFNPQRDVIRQVWVIIRKKCTSMFLKKLFLFAMEAA